jgi:hypothetical protein
MGQFTFTYKDWNYVKREYGNDVWRGLVGLHRILCEWRVAWSRRPAQDPVWMVWNGPKRAQCLLLLTGLNLWIPRNALRFSIPCDMNCAMNTWIVELDLACYIKAVCGISSEARSSVSALRCSRPVSECMTINKTLTASSVHHAAVHQQLWLGLRCMLINDHCRKCSAAVCLTFYGSLVSICTASLPLSILCPCVYTILYIDKQRYTNDKTQHSITFIQIPTCFDALVHHLQGGTTF